MLHLLHPQERLAAGLLELGVKCDLILAKDGSGKVGVGEADRDLSLC